MTDSGPADSWWSLRGGPFQEDHHLARPKLCPGHAHLLKTSIRLTGTSLGRHTTRAHARRAHTDHLRTNPNEPSADDERFMVSDQMTRGIRPPLWIHEQDNQGNFSCRSPMAALRAAPRPVSYLHHTPYGPERTPSPPAIHYLQRLSCPSQPALHVPPGFITTGA